MRDKILVSLIMLATALTSTVTTVAQSTGLEEIVVTARKRAENLQDLGLSVSALNKQDILERFDSDLSTLQNAAPNLVINDIQQGPGSPAAISIRGVGTTDVEKNFDPTVGVVIDGIFIGVNSGAMLKAIDLESVEILRGPQGTLFGRNSIGGIINVKRSRPDFDGTSGMVRVGAGNEGNTELDGYVNFTVSDTLAFRLGAAKRDSDGFFYNTTLGRDTGESEFTIISPSFTWRPSEGIEVYYRFDKTDQEQDANTILNLAQSDQVFCFYYQQCSQGLQTPQAGSKYTVLQNDDPPYQTYFDTKTHILDISWELNDQYSVEFVYGGFETEEAVYQDWDATPLTLYHTDRPAEWEQDSFELRLNYSGDQLKYTAGLYYWDSEYSIDLTSYIGFGSAIGFWPAELDPFFIALDQTVAQETESTAFFIEADYEISDSTTLTLGGRYTEDDKSSAVTDVLTPGLLEAGGPSNPSKASWSEFTPKAGLRYRLNDDAMAYLLYSKGFRAGGYNGRPGGGEYISATTPYAPETVNNFEIGFKSEWLDGNLRLNVSAFSMQYEDKQEEQSVPTAGGTGQQTLVVNASEAKIQGLEADFSWKISDAFTIKGNLGLLDAEYDELSDPSTGTDLTYLSLRRAPDMTATITPVVTIPMGSGMLSARASLRFVDDMELTFLNSPQSGVNSHTTLDASVTYSWDNFRVSVWGLNLSDDDSWTQAYDVGTSVNFAGLWTYTAVRPPRTYGVVLNYDF